MNVLLLSQYCDPEPAPHSTILAEMLRVQHNHNVSILSSLPTYPGGRIYEGYRFALRTSEVIRGTPILRVPLFPSHDRSALHRFLTYSSFAASATLPGSRAVGLRPDLVYAYHPPGTIGLPALTWKWARRTPFVYHIADLWPDSIIAAVGLGSWRTKALESLLDAWCSLIYKEASAITVLSEGMKSILIERGVPADIVHVVYNWAEESIFRPTLKDQDLARSLQMDRRFNAVYAGNLGAYQDLDTVVRAAARITGLATFQVVLIGTGTERSRLQELARSLGATNVIFHDRIPYRDMGRVNALADCLIVSLKALSFFEATIPSKLQVALASARPVIGIIRGESAAIIERAQAGMTCEPGDDAALAEVFTRMYGLDETGRDRMAASGRAYYERHMSLETGAAKISSVLESARR